VSVSLFTTSNLIFIGFAGGDVAAGYYSAAEKYIRHIIRC
jgi:O-antigen/teichoic acid export membrane protein